MEFSGSGCGRVLAYDIQRRGVCLASPPSNNTYAFDAHTGTLLWTANTGTPYLPSQPAILNNLVYAVTGNIYALDAKTGAVAWSAGDSYGLVGVPTLSDGRIYVAGGLDYSVSCFNAATGQRLWKRTLDWFVSRPIAIAKGVAYVVEDNGSMVFLNAYTGDIVRQIQAQNGDFASVAVANGVVYAGTQNVGGGGTVYAIDASTGDILWTHGTGVILAGPAVANGTLYVGAAGWVQAFSLP